jgi:hypothetical protein
MLTYTQGVTIIILFLVVLGLQLFVMFTPDKPERRTDQPPQTVLPKKVINSTPVLSTLEQREPFKQLRVGIEEVSMTVSNGVSDIIYGLGVMIRHKYTYVSFAYVVNTSTTLKRTRRPCITVYWLMEKQDTSRVVNSACQSADNKDEYDNLAQEQKWDLNRDPRQYQRYKQHFQRACHGGRSLSCAEVESETFTHIEGSTGQLAYDTGFPAKVLIGRLEVWHDGKLLASWESLTPTERENLTIAPDWYLKGE